MVPEILAPAGDRTSLAAALAAGADAVYFGLDDGFNARARATNFPLDGLEAVVAEIHAHRARAYLALNTLVFESELEKLEPILARIASAGVDALIVQDPAVALLARAICPELELHASTQMTISSPEGAAFAAELGVTRVVVPRELSVDEIARFRRGCDLELEVFIMGALCVSWSGQCLSSETWGGRSANRGQCAQACRLPYELVVDDQPRPLGEVSYLLSPRDLAGFRAVERLMEIGVHTLKIEGRQKGPEYVKTAVHSLRDWLDAVADGRPDPKRLAENVRDLSLTYSRGFGDGFLFGSDHQTLVEGITPRHRGLLLGVVERVEPRHVVVRATHPEPVAALGELACTPPALGGSTTAASGAAAARLRPRAGMGVVFCQGDEQAEEQGGPIFSVERKGSSWRLGFGQPGPDLSAVKPGARVQVTSDPKAARGRHGQARGQDLMLVVSGSLGSAMTVEARLGPKRARVESATALASATGAGLDQATLVDKLGALGGTPFRLGSLENRLAPGLFVPVSELKKLRRELVEQLESQRAMAPRACRPGPHLEGLRQAVEADPGPAYLVALCRQAEHLEAAIASGVQRVELDWMEMVGLNAAVERARQAGLEVGLATVRVQKPGEEVYDRRIERLNPDCVLVRHWGAVSHFSGLDQRPVLHGDFSLNVTNSLTARHVLSRGLSTVTAAHDLDEVQLLAMLDRVPASRVAVTIHHHIPTFHTEHCVYSHLLSQGRDFRSCGRPCEKHQVALRDRVGGVHPVIVDVGCRNTVFNAAAQTAAQLVPKLVERGVRRLRIEFVRETRQQAERVLGAYQALLAGRLTPTELLEQVGVHEQFGVTAGTMKVLS
ncbi:MAG: DUF3656 domain-containing protein [Vulcanimicrobiota bacterium]